MKEMFKRWFSSKPDAPPERDGEYVKLPAKDVCIGDILRGVGVVTSKYTALRAYRVWVDDRYLVIGLREYVWVKR